MTSWAAELQNQFESSSIIWLPLMILHELPVIGDKVCLDQKEPRLVSSLEPSSSSEDAASRGGPGTGCFSTDRSPHRSCDTLTDTLTWATGRNYGKWLNRERDGKREKERKKEGHGLIVPPTILFVVSWKLKGSPVRWEVSIWLDRHRRPALLHCPPFIFMHWWGLSGLLSHCSFFFPELISNLEEIRPKGEGLTPKGTLIRCSTFLIFSLSLSLSSQPLPIIPSSCSWDQTKSCCSVVPCLLPMSFLSPRPKNKRRNWKHIFPSPSLKSFPTV